MIHFLQPLAEQFDAVKPDGSLDIERLKNKIRLDIHQTGARGVVACLKRLPNDDGKHNLRVLFCQTLVY